MKILFCFGTRPEWLKIKPIIQKLEKNEYKIYFTGQHQDLVEQIGFDYTSNILTNNNRLDDIIISSMTNFPTENFDYVLVQGDTGSAFSCALSAYNRKLKIIHLEAGLRSYDLENPYPEESYRQLISRISDINFCPTKISESNLKNEKIFGKTFVVGNTALDNITHLKSKTQYLNKVLITLHRRENHTQVKDWFLKFNEIGDIFKNLTFILPIHPNPNLQKYKNLLSDRIVVVNPLSHFELLEILKDCKFVITDSGGIQEESVFLNKKVIVCRSTTERPEGIQTGHIFLCDKPLKLNELVYNLNENYYIDEDCPYGDGLSSNKIINILKNGHNSP